MNKFNKIFHRSIERVQSQTGKDATGTETVPGLLGGRDEELIATDEQQFPNEFPATGERLKESPEFRGQRGRGRVIEQVCQ